MDDNGTDVDKECVDKDVLIAEIYIPYCAS